MMLVNGKQATSLPVSDRGLQYGDGVWETILIKQGRLLLLAEHLDRLQLGLNCLGIALSFNQLYEEIEQIRQQADNHILKIIITRGSGGRGYNPKGLLEATRILSLHPVPEFSRNYHKKGVDLTLCQTRLAHNPALAGFKHLNRLEQVMARAEFGGAYQEGLVRDYADNIIEGTMSNVFLIKDDKIRTPVLDNCGIRGVMQAYVLQQLSAELFDWQADISVADVQNADAVFLTNSVIGVWPVKSFSVESLKTCYSPHSIIQKLQQKIN